MKKWIALLIASTLGSALAVDRVHVGLPYVGFSTDFGDNELRFTASPYNVDVAVPIRLSSDSSYVYVAPQAGFFWNTGYYSPFGAGFSAGASIGYNYRVNEDWRIYGEAGPAFYLSNGFSIGWNAKLGASFALR